MLFWPFYNPTNLKDCEKEGERHSSSRRRNLKTKPTKFEITQQRSTPQTTAGPSLPSRLSKQLREQPRTAPGGAAPRAHTRGTAPTKKLHQGGKQTCTDRTPS